MSLYIQIENGQPVNHPATEDNLLAAYGQIPSDWQPFIRVERPFIKVYEVLESETPLYQNVNGTWMDVWPIRDMTSEERLLKQQSVKDEFNARPQAANWSTWLFDEDACMMVPPIPRPEPDNHKLSQGVRTFWCGAENAWKDTPICPSDGYKYKFDFLAWSWTRVTE